MATLNENSRISRKTIIMIVAGITAAMIAIFFCLRYPCICGRFIQGQKKCDTFQYIKSKPYINPLSKKKDPIPSPPIKIKCNEFVIDPSHQAAEYYRDKLRALCFELGQTCNCTPAFELWVNPTGNPVDAGTVAANTVLSRPMGTEASGFFPNVIVNLNIPKDTGIVRIDSSKIKILCQDQIMNPNKDNIKIAIVDTGVDTIPGPNNRLNNYGWTKYHNPTRCITNPSTFGLNILNTQREPSDMLGHGTLVNGVVIGESYPNYKDSELDIIFLNANIFKTDDTTCTLFDGLCALNYSVHQKADIVNISWGFAFNPENDNQGILKKCIEAAIKKVINAAPNTLFIAALGNDDRFVSHDYRFYPACLAESDSNLMAIGSLSYDTSDIAGFSNYADTNIMTFCTQGENIFAAFPSYLAYGNNERLVSGTSYAAPLAARVSASFWIRNPDSSAAAVKNHFLKNLSTSPMSSTSKGNLHYRALTLQQIEGLICTPPKPIKSGI